jgi:hypothetical protein
MRPFLSCSLLLFIVACPGPEPVADGGTAGGAPTAGGSSGGSGGGSAGGMTGGGTSDAGCVPMACGSSCGMVPDGCGGMLACQPCACTPSTFATDCPAGPCTVATGCQNNACVYGPVSCDSEACSSCALPSGPDGGCTATDLRGCGAASCAATFCDPSPVMMGNRVVYRNQCVARSAVRCGLCELGGLQCSDAGVSCSTPVIPEVNLQRLECDGASPAATVIFCDPSFDGGTPTGARTAPYRSFQEALGEASRRGSRGVIIGGSPLIEQTLVVQNGVSVLGGFARAPSFVREPSQQPVFQPVVSYLDGGTILDGGVFGVVATGVTTGTLLANFAVRVPAISRSAPIGISGANTIGVYLNGTQALALAQVSIEVGQAQTGGPGAIPGMVVAQTPVSQMGMSSGFVCPTISNTQVIFPGGSGQASTCDSVPKPSSRGGDGFGLRVNFSTTGFGQPSYSATVIPFSFEASGADANRSWTGPASTGLAGQASLTWRDRLPGLEGRGGTGTEGSPGPGGGGGGALSSLPGSGSCLPAVPTGGAGGAGGCGGRGGLGGLPAGIAAGLVVAGPTMSRAAFGEIIVSLPGRALGGAGSPGSSGTQGAPGAPRSPPTTTGGTLGLNGGRGADGQPGGSGGPGASGLVRGVLCEQPQPVSRSSFRITFPSDAGVSDGGLLDLEGCL